MTKQQATVPFGSQDIKPDTKTQRVQHLFERVASRYDLMNDVMSGGLHRLWKQEMIRALSPQPNQTILDVAGGTGDIAFGILKTQPSAKVMVCDLTPGMMGVGQQRALPSYKSSLQWVCGDAAHLPLPDNSVDVYTIAFGLRNVTDMQGALTEAHRVLKPHGHFLCLEFSQVKYPVLDKLYEIYSFKLLPKFGQWIARDQAAYQYLVESIKRFPNQELLKHKITEAGFTSVTYQNFSAGIAALHSAYKE